MRKLSVLLGVASIALAAASPAAAGSQFTCNGNFQFVRVSGLVVPPGATCTISLSTVEGDVTVMKGADIRASATQIGGDVKVRDALRMVLDGATRVAGNVDVKGTNETTLVDSQFGAVRVQGASNGSEIRVFNNSIGGDLQIEHNTAFMVVNLNTVVGDVRIDKNVENLTAEGNSVRNMYVFNNTGSASVQFNTGLELRCEDNEGFFNGGPNTFERTEGQCF